jgi:hypothetical protein
LLLLKKGWITFKKCKNVKLTKTSLVSLNSVVCCIHLAKSASKPEAGYDLSSTTKCGQICLHFVAVCVSNGTARLKKCKQLFEYSYLVTPGGQNFNNIFIFCLFFQHQSFYTIPAA